MALFQRRRLLFLFDSFNELPEQMQRPGSLVLQRFVEKHSGQHVCVLASRRSAHLEQLARGLVTSKQFEILRLNEDQVAQFLGSLGLGWLIERMPAQLRELAGNPFMLVAISRALPNDPETALPRNQGKLYERFVASWLKNEQKRRASVYSQERVKAPLLAHLALKLTVAGQTSIRRTDALEDDIEELLKQVYEGVKRRGGMPADWTVDGCLAEAFSDGLILQQGDQISFMHQSIQEYFTGWYFKEGKADTLVALTPKLRLASLSDSDLAEVPNQRFVTPLFMMLGLLEDSTLQLTALAERNPILAAAGIAAASKVDPQLVQSLERGWLALLATDDAKQEALGLACLVLAAPSLGPGLFVEVARYVLSPTASAWLAGETIEKLASPRPLVAAVIDTLLAATDDEFVRMADGRRLPIASLEVPSVARQLFERWRTAAPDSPTKRRTQQLMADLDDEELQAELNQIRAGAPDSALARDVELALSQLGEWVPVKRRFNRRTRKGAQLAFGAQLGTALAAAATKADGELLSDLASPDPVLHTAAAKLALSRGLPVIDAVVERALTSRALPRPHLVEALVSSLGEPAFVDLLEQRIAQTPRVLGYVPSRLVEPLAAGRPYPELRQAMESLGVPAHLDMEEELPPRAGSFRTWKAQDGELQIELCWTAGADAQLCDVRSGVVAVGCLGQLGSSGARAVLLSLLVDGHVELRRAAIKHLAQRGDASLVPPLLLLLQGTPPTALAAQALEAIDRVMSTSGSTAEQLSLLPLYEDLLACTLGKEDDYHARWGTGSWGYSIHSIFKDCELDTRLKARLVVALDGTVTREQECAMAELARWYDDVDSDERAAIWKTSELSGRVAFLALAGGSRQLRRDAARAVRSLELEQPPRAWLDALAAPDLETRLLAAEALAVAEASSVSTQVATLLHSVACGPHPLDVRRRAAAVLTELPGGAELVHRPITEAMERDELPRALKSLEDALAIMLGDTTLYWWRAHVLREQGQWTGAVADFQRVAQEAENPVVLNALAQTLLLMDDTSRAREAAARAVSIDEADVDAQALLGWTCFRLGELERAVEAARTAVDLDPAHGQATWTLQLALLKAGKVVDARAALVHTRRLHELSSLPRDVLDFKNVRHQLQGLSLGADEGIAALAREALTLVDAT